MEKQLLSGFAPSFLSRYNMTKTYLNMIWSERFWFPDHVTWSDMENTADGVRHPQVDQLHFAIITTILLTLLRFLLENFVFNKLALAFGLKYARRAERDDALDQFYAKEHSPSSAQIAKLVAELKSSTRKVERWLRVKRNENHCKVKKFSECAWRLVFYTCLFVFGVYVLYDETWALNAKQSIGISSWPHHHIKAEFHIYYMIELGFYLSLLLSLFSDVRRSDFNEQAIHHVATITLIVFSWTANFVRIGMLVLTVHDAADAWLQLTKIAVYLRRRVLEVIFMTIFTSLWVYSRVYVYPLYIVLPILEETYDKRDIVWPAVLVMVSCLVLLQILHFIWTYLIFNAVFKSLQTGGLKDTRSEDEATDSED